MTNTSISNPKSLFDGAPGPTPWYSRPGAPAVEGFHWEYESGKTLLVGNVGVVAVLNAYNYVMRLDSSSLLIWNQRRETGDQHTPPVHLIVIRPALLPCFGGNLQAEISRMDEANARLALSEPPDISMYLTTDLTGEDIPASFPKEIQLIDELLILCDSSAIAPREDGINANLALLVAKPRLSTYRLYPQDWINSSNLDFGYQWITRVARDPQTGRVRGEGFRLKPFELDESLRQLARGTQSESDFYRGV